MRRLRLPDSGDGCRTRSSGRADAENERLNGGRGDAGEPRDDGDRLPSSCEDSPAPDGGAVAGAGDWADAAGGGGGRSGGARGREGGEGGRAGTCIVRGGS